MRQCAGGHSGRSRQRDIHTGLQKTQICKGSKKTERRANCKNCYMPAMERWKTFPKIRSKCCGRQPLGGLTGFVAFGWHRLSYFTSIPPSPSLSPLPFPSPSSKTDLIPVAYPPRQMDRPGPVSTCSSVFKIHADRYWKVVCFTISGAQLCGRCFKS